MYHFTFHFSHFTWMEGSTLRGKFLTQEHNTMTGSALEPRSLHLELSVLTTLVPCLKMRRKKK